MRILFAFIVAALIAPSCLIAQSRRISIGVKGGLAGDVGPSYGLNESKPYLVGPAIELRVAEHLAFEFSALYRRLGSSYTFGQVNPPPEVADQVVTIYASSRGRGNSWEFPLVGKYYFNASTSKWRPFLGTGYSFTRDSFKATTVSRLSSAPLTDLRSNANWSKTSIGVVFVAGVAYKLGWLTVVPEGRFTRRNDPGLRGKNQADFLLGLRW